MTRLQSALPGEDRGSGVSYFPAEFQYSSYCGEVVSAWPCSTLVSCNHWGCRGRTSRRRPKSPLRMTARMPSTFQEDLHRPASYPAGRIRGMWQGRLAGPGNGDRDSDFDSISSGDGKCRRGAVHDRGAWARTRSVPDSPFGWHGRGSRYLLAGLGHSFERNRVALRNPGIHPQPAKARTAGPVGARRNRPRRPRTWRPGANGMWFGGCFTERGHGPTRPAAGGCG